MAVQRSEERNAFERFVRQIKKQYHPDKVLLFGSRARNEASSVSDYDLLIVASSFDGTRLTDRATEIYRIWPLWADLDCLCLTPAEYERSRQLISVVREIDQEGVPL